MRNLLKKILKETLLKEGMSMHINGVLLRKVLKFYYDNDFYEFTDTQSSGLAGQNSNYLDINKAHPLIRLRVPENDPSGTMIDFYNSFDGETKKRIDDIFVSRLNFLNWLKDFEIQIYKNALKGAYGYATGTPRQVQILKDKNHNSEGYQAVSVRTNQYRWLRNNTQYMTVGEMHWWGETKSDLRQVILNCLKKNTIYHEFQHILQNEYKIHKQFKHEEPATSNQNVRYVNLNTRQKQALNIDNKDIIVTPDGHEAYRRRKGKHPFEFVKMTSMWQFRNFLNSKNVGFVNPQPQAKFYSKSNNTYSHRKTGHPFTVFFHSTPVTARSYDDHSKPWGERNHEDNADVAGKTQRVLFSLKNDYNMGSVWLLSDNLEAAVQKWINSYMNQRHIRTRVSHQDGYAELEKLKVDTVAYIVEKVSEVDWQNFITLKELQDRRWPQKFKDKWESLWADDWV